MREITFDTETTGMDPNTGHRIVEIGCIELVDKIRTGNFFHAYINPEREVPKAATAIHGLSDEFLADKPVFAKVAKEFLEFIGSDRLVIHNAAFDMKFINYELERAGQKHIEYHRTVDTLVMARKKFPGAKASLDALCTRYGIDLSRRDKHGALLDAELLADVYLELLGGAQGMMKLESTESEQTAVAFDTKRKRPLRERRNFPVSEEELAAHAEFLKKIKNAMWQ